MSTVIHPTITAAGRAAALSASNLGLELELTHVSFGTGHYDPIGDETALEDEVSPRIPIAGGSRPTPTQVRMIAAWRADTGTHEIGEVAFWAGTVLFAVWSRADGTVLATKTPGVDFVLFNDLSLTQVPPGSVNVLIDPDVSAALAALGVHEGDPNPHTQYVRHAEFIDAQAHLWCLVGGTANALELAVPADVLVTAYAQGQVFRFMAAAANTDEVTADVEGLGPVPVYKSGSDPLAPADIRPGAIYDLIYDGAAFQLAGGVGGGAFFKRFEYVATAGQTDFAAVYTPGNILVLHNGREIGTDSYTAADGAVVTLSYPAAAGDDVQVIAFGVFNVADTYTKGEYAALHASEAEAQAGTSLLRWMSPSRVVTTLRALVAQASETLRGTLRIGTQAEVNAGSLDDVAVTPKKLRWGFTHSWGVNNYIVLPSWLGGLVIQFGSFTVTNTTQAVTFPIAFPAACRGVLMSQSPLTSGFSEVAQPDDVTTTGFNMYTNVGSGTVWWLAIGQ